MQTNHSTVLSSLRLSFKYDWLEVHWYGTLKLLLMAKLPLKYILFLTKTKMVPSV